MFTQSSLNEIEEIISQYPDSRSALLPVLLIAQRDFDWLSPDALQGTAEVLNLTPAFVREVASFYSMLRNEPVGKYVVQFCTNVSCMLLGAEELLDVISAKFGLKPNEISADGRFTLRIMECIGACEDAPAMLINDKLHTNLTAESIIQILQECQ